MIPDHREIAVDTVHRNPMNAQRGEWVPVRDDRRVYIRPWQPEDQSEVAALLARLSPRSIAQRFHSAGIRITAAVLDQVTAGHSLVAELEGQIVALASYNPVSSRYRAEMGIVVDDVFQRQGIGAALCSCLCRDARRAGIRRLRAEVQTSNRVMLRLLRRLNFPMVVSVVSGVFEIDLELCLNAP
jgi:RimJ/RimL family protein N-acetyltransferase